MQPDKSKATPDTELSGDLSNFARRLCAFEPRSLAINRDQVMFEAGREAGRNEVPHSALASQRTLRLWQSASIGLSVVSASLIAMIVGRTDPEPRVVYVERDSAIVRPISNLVGMPAEDAEDLAFVERPRIDSSMSSDLLREVKEKSVDEMDVIHGRQTVVSQLLGPRFDLDESRRRSVESGRFRPDESSPSQWNPRALMFNHGSRSWMNRLIEEPTL